MVRRGRVGRVMIAGGLALALLGAACADGASGGANAGYGGGPSPSPAAGGGGGYGGGGGGGSGSGGSADSVLTLTQVNYRFTPATITVTKGDTITVSDTNPSTPHTFTIPRTDIDVANDPMGSTDVAIDLKPGTYTFFCRFHRSQGMTGTLIVG